LTKASAALDPLAGDALEKNSSLASVIEHINPGVPESREAFCKEDTVEGLPTYRIKGFSEV
jgi:hypothetical protein